MKIKDIIKTLDLQVISGEAYLEREVKNEEKDPINENNAAKKKDEYKKIEVPTEGISIQLVLDRSGSMGTFSGRNGINYNFMKFENTLLRMYT